MEKFKSSVSAAAVVLALCFSTAQAASQVVFVPEYPVHSSMAGVMAGSMLSFSGDAAIQAFDALVKAKNPLRTIPYDPTFASGSGYQEISSSQLSCMHTFSGHGSSESTHCATHLDREQGPQAWGAVRTDDDESLDNGFGSRGAASTQRINSTVTVKRASASKLAITVTGAAAATIRDAKFSQKVAQCAAKSCVVNVSVSK